MHRIILKILTIFSIFILILFLSENVFAEPEDVHIETQISEDFNVFTTINFNLLNDKKNKTIEYFEIILPNQVSGLKITADSKEILYEKISENLYKLSLNSPLNYNSYSKIHLEFQSSNAIQKLGKLTEISLIGYDFTSAVTTIIINRKIGSIIYNSCNCKDDGDEIQYKFSVSSNKPTLFYIGTFQSFIISFNTKDLEDKILDINIPDNDVNQLIFYNSSNTIPNKLIYNQNFNLYAEFNNVKLIDFKYSIIRDKLTKNEPSKLLEDIYYNFINKFSYCRNNVAEECRNFNLIANFQLLLNKNSINSRIVCGYQYDYFKSNKTLSYWLEIAGENNIQEIDPFLEIQMGNDYFFQKDPNRFKIYNYGDQISTFKEGIMIPIQMTIDLNQEPIKIDDNIIESRVLKKQNINEKIPENYYLVFTNKSSQIVTLKDIKLSPINTLLLSKNDKLYIYPNNSIEVDLGAFFDDLKTSSKISYSYKLNNKWVTSSYDIDKSNWMNEEQVSLITTLGYIILISLSIFFGLWIVMKREV